jgi:hypothetical protein
VHQTGFRGESRPSYRRTSPGHRNAWGQRAVKGFIGGVYYGRSRQDSELRKEVQVVSSGWLDGDAVMIGLVPCKLSSELHVNGRRVFRAKDKGVEREVLASDAGRSFKCS